MTARSLEIANQTALRVLHKSMSEIAPKPSKINKQYPIVVLGADYYEYSGTWIRFRLEKENMPGFVFEQDFFSRDLEEYCEKHHDLEGMLFESWWSNLEWYEKQIICEAYVKRQGIGMEMAEAYSAWKKEQSIS